MNEADRKALVDDLRRVLSAQTDVRFAYLFGSTARERSRRSSDVDVAVFLDGEGAVASAPSAAGRGDPDRARRAARALELEAELERALPRPVQVVTLNDVPLGLAHNVLRSGLLLLCSDESAHLHFYVSHARRYYDMEPARRIFDRYRSRRIREGTFGGGSRDRP